MNTINLRAYALSQANEDGREFINRWITFSEITAHVEGRCNWDYIIYGDGRIASISKKDSGGAKSSFFGDINHCKKLVREGHASPEVNKLIELLTPKP